MAKKFLAVMLVVACYAYEEPVQSSWCVDRPWSHAEAVKRDVRIVDVPLGSTVTLQCSFCGEIDRGEPKLWYLSDRTTGRRRKEVCTGMADRLESNRVYMTPDHRLVMRNLTTDDAGQYICSSLGGGAKAEEVKFALDLIPDGAVAAVSATSPSHWSKYEADYLKVIGRKNSTALEGVRLEPEWMPWGPCDGCAGKRYKRAACRVRFGNNVRMACRSISLSRVSPDLAEALSLVPDFLLSETCYAYCRLNRRRPPKYRNTFLLEEGSSLTLVCAEATADKKVTWRKDGLLLSESPADVGDVTGVQLDSFGILYLVRLTVGNSGNYTCYINGNRTQEVLVAVRKPDVFSSPAARIFYGFLNRRTFLKITEKDMETPEITPSFLGKQIRIRYVSVIENKYNDDKTTSYFQKIQKVMTDHIKMGKGGYCKSDTYNLGCLNDNWFYNKTLSSKF